MKKKQKLRPNRKAQRESDFQRAYKEFCRYYQHERCEWAPKNPKRLFALATTGLYQVYRTRVTLWQLMDAIYRTLGYQGPKGRGLFHDFDPDKYQGDRPLADHFVSMFKARLWANLRRAVTTAGRAKRLKAVKRLEGHDPEWRPLARLQETLMLGFLDDAIRHLNLTEQSILDLRYWRDCSFRRAGQEMGVDPKTAKAHHDRAIRRLRRLLLAG